MMDAKKIFSLLSRFFLSPFHRWIIIHHDLDSREKSNNNSCATKNSKKREWCSIRRASSMLRYCYCKSRDEAGNEGNKDEKEWEYRKSVDPKYITVARYIL